MDEGVLNNVNLLLGDKSIEAIYLYGSYVNGYYRNDSDIDIIALTSQNSRKKPIEKLPNLSIHFIHPLTVEFYSTGHPYTHLRMTPLYNEPKCTEISDRLKSELVKRQLLIFRDNDISDFDVLDPIKNYLLKYCIQRPWRIKPIKRLLSSEESRNILTDEYARIMRIWVDRGMIFESERSYSINPDFVFDENLPVQKDSLRYTINQSAYGWHYARNISLLIDSSRRVIR
ncbi:MAG TPA: nucleotidyltransferase domain-containing protein [Candidatus Nanoarchaeia archaeon]|nr:nucleotidyltransferase domain-containing protein [Candidatus Nanoarchaeia archaeon]